MNWLAIKRLRIFFFIEKKVLCLSAIVKVYLELINLAD